MNLLVYILGLVTAKVGSRSIRAQRPSRRGAKEPTTCREKKHLCLKVVGTLRGPGEPSLRIGQHVKQMQHAKNWYTNTYQKTEELNVGKQWQGGELYVHLPCNSPFPYSNDSLSKMLAHIAHPLSSSLYLSLQLQFLHNT